jgi:hypothetical protein
LKSHRRKQGIAGLVLIFAVTFLYQGCYAGTGIDTASLLAPPSSANEALYWAEVQGRFYTKNLTRAQEEIPFPMVIPGYLPGKRNDTLLPDIAGPLKEYQHDHEVRIHILYVIDLGNEARGTIEIEESNFPVIPPDPRLDPGVEHVQIAGETVVKVSDNPESLQFFFNQNGIYFIVESHNLTDEEVLKIVESMIQQTE